MKKRLNSKALSTIVSTLLILLLVFVAIGILWSVVRTFIQSGSEEVSLGKYTLDLQIDSVAINDTNNTAYVKVQRNVGTGNFSALKFVFSDDSESESIVYNQSLLENEKLTFSFILSKLNVSNLVTVEVIPIFILSSGKTSTGDVKDTYYVKEGYSVRITTGNPETNTTTNTTNTSTCTDTCSSLGYTCGTQTVCGSSVNCGSCSSGYICSGSSCISNTTTCTDTCSSLGYTCGTQTVCGSSVSCGTCGSGYVCSSGNCVASTCSDAIDFDNVCTPGCTPQEDVDCAATMAEIDFPMKTYTDYANIVYIDPDTGSSSNDGSSPSKALSAWSDVGGFNANTAYVQKRGTIDYRTSRLTISVDNVYIGSYGDASLPPATIMATGDGSNYFTTIIAMYGNYGYIRDITISGKEMDSGYISQSVRMGGYHSSTDDDPANVNKWNTVYNISSINAGIGGWGYGSRIRYLTLHDVPQDGVFLQYAKYLEVGYSNIYRTNLGWFNPDCYPTCDMSYAYGDLIQIGPAGNWWIHDTILDKSDTGNKFAFIGEVNNGLGIFENNIIYGPLDTAEGGAAMYLTAGINNSFIIRNNIFYGPDPMGLYIKPNSVVGPNKEVYNNTFINTNYLYCGGCNFYNNTLVNVTPKSSTGQYVTGTNTEYDNIII